jgi:hypothetical protein
MAQEIGTIEHGSRGGYMASGRPAVDLIALIHLKSALKLEINCPGLRMSRHMSALKAAKTRTGLRTNDRAAHLARVEAMIEEANSRVIHVIEQGDNEL